jgi:hypothetical protein
MHYGLKIHSYKGTLAPKYHGSSSFMYNYIYIYNGVRPRGITIFIGFTSCKTLNHGAQKWLQIHADDWLQSLVRVFIVTRPPVS